MMSPGDSDLQKRIVNAFIKYFLNPETSVIAVETTLKCLLAMKQEYNIHDNTSWTAIITSKVNVPFSIGKVDHLEKIDKCMRALDGVKTQPVESLGKSAVDTLLEFFKKSEDWHTEGRVRGAAINMRLTCELLQEAGVEEDCGSFLQKYSGDFLKELEAAAAKKLSTRVVEKPPAMELIISATLGNREAAANPLTPLKTFLDESQPRLLFIVDQTAPLPPAPPQTNRPYSPSSALFSVD